LHVMESLQITILHRAGFHRRVRRGMLFQD
jgi:hypothetical protein